MFYSMYQRAQADEKEEEEEKEKHRRQEEDNPPEQQIYAFGKRDGEKTDESVLDPPWKAVFGGLTAVVIVGACCAAAERTGPGACARRRAGRALLIGVERACAGSTRVGCDGRQRVEHGWRERYRRLDPADRDDGRICSYRSFTQIHAVWLFVFCGGIYAVMLLLDTLLTIRLIRRKRWDKEIDGAEPEWPDFWPLKVRWRKWPETVFTIPLDRRFPLPTTCS